MAKRGRPRKHDVPQIGPDAAADEIMEMADDDSTPETEDDYTGGTEDETLDATGEMVVEADEDESETDEEIANEVHVLTAADLAKLDKEDARRYKEAAKAGGMSQARREMYEKQVQQRSGRRRYKFTKADMMARARVLRARLKNPHGHSPHVIQQAKYELKLMQQGTWFVDKQPGRPARYPSMGKNANRKKFEAIMSM